MKNIIALGKWFFVLSFFLYVGLHFALPEVGAAMLPDFFPFKLFTNYITGIGILVFIVCCIIGKYDQLAAIIMSGYVLLTIFLIHIPHAKESSNDMLNIFRNIMVIGGLLMYAGAYARHRTVVA